MRNSLLLFTVATGLVLGAASRTHAQAPPAATTPNPTNEPASGVLTAPVVFEWKSGYLIDFIAQIKKVFGIDLSQRADIPEQMFVTKVPSMRIKTANVWEVIKLYNSISDDYPGLGNWVVKRSPDDLFMKTEPNAVILVPSKQADIEDSSSVRAFTLRDIPGPEQEQLFKLIDVEQSRLQKLGAERGIKSSLLRGDVHFHKETGICVATGGKTYVEMVGSLIDAFREGRQSQGRPAVPYPTKRSDEK